MRIWCWGLRVSDKHGPACSNSVFSWVTTQQSTNQMGPKKRRQPGETFKTYSTPHAFIPLHLCEYQPNQERRHGRRQLWASVLFSWRSWKVISHQGMTQTGASIIYPGWVNVGTLSSAAEGLLGRDPLQTNNVQQLFIWPVLWVLRLVSKLLRECCWFVVVYLPAFAPTKTNNATKFKLREENHRKLRFWGIIRATDWSAEQQILNWQFSNKNSLFCNILILDVYSTWDSQTRISTAVFLFYASTQDIVHIVGL